MPRPKMMDRTDLITEIEGADLHITTALNDVKYDDGIDLDTLSDLLDIAEGYIKDAKAIINEGK